MLRKIFDMQYQMLEKFPALRPAKPLIDAGDNFFYGPSHVTEEKTHVRDGIDLKRFMITVLFAVLPTAAAAVYFFGLRALLIILVSYVVGGLAEVLFCIVRKEEITEGFLITGILYPLILPVTTPLWMVALGIVVGVILGKEVFGGSGRNPFNAALVARCFLYICFPLQMTGAAFTAPIDSFRLDGWRPQQFEKGGFVVWQQSADAATQATPLAAQKQLRLAAFGEETQEIGRAHV